MHYTIEIFDDYLHGELGSERDAVIHAHLEECTACRALYDESVGVREWIHSAAIAEEREFPSMIKARVWQAVRDRQPSLADRVRAWWRPMLAVPLAAAVAVLAFVGLPSLQHGTAPTGIAATYLLEEHAALASENPLADRGFIVPASVNEGQRSLMDAGDTATAASSDQ
jgi:predicted anti-sigma-YlaC factor YlaD